MASLKKIMFSGSPRAVMAFCKNSNFSLSVGYFWAQLPTVSVALSKERSEGVSTAAVAISVSTNGMSGEDVGKTGFLM